MANTVVSCLIMKTMELRMERIQPMAKQMTQPSTLVFHEHLQLLTSSLISS